MNIMYLKYAVEVEKARSISRAAQKLYIAQPNLSRALKELEDDLGITIFNRTPHGMQVTDEGEEFLERATKILRRNKKSRPDSSAVRANLWVITSSWVL